MTSASVTQCVRVKCKETTAVTVMTSLPVVILDNRRRSRWLNTNDFALLIYLSETSPDGEH